jgi:membrane fusion protein
VQDALFRSEVFESRQDAWLGDVALTRHISWLALTLGFLGLAIALIGYSVWGEYTRKIRASGYVVPNVGVLKVAASQSGVVSKLLVSEGQHVASGDTVAILNAERATSSGDASVEVKKQIDARLAALRQEQVRVNELYDGQAKALITRLGNLRVELAQIDISLRLQNERIRLTDQMLANQRKLSADGFISQMALQQKEQERMGDLSNLAALQRSRTALERDIDAAEADKASLNAKRANDLSSIDRSLAALEQDRIENETRREILIKAPQSGIVTAIVTDAGKLAIPGQSLLNLIPDGAELQADIYLPSRAAGFVHVGSHALLQFQAFPYQKFGNYRAQVIKMSRVALAATDLPYPAPAGAVPTDLFYIASLALPRKTVLAYGKDEPLQPGMGFDAQLVLETRSLLEWIFEPLISISGNWGR